MTQITEKAIKIESARIEFHWWYDQYIKGLQKWIIEPDYMQFMVDNYYAKIVAICQFAWSLDIITQKEKDELCNKAAIIVAEG